MPEYFKSKYIIVTGNKVLENAAIIVENGKIVDVTDDKGQILCCAQNDNFVDFGNAVIMPGFINLHTHLQYTDLVPGILTATKPPQNDGFGGWAVDLMNQYSALSEPEKIRSFKNGLKETVLSGCTGVAQLSKEEMFVDMLKDSGIKSFVFLETFANSEEASIREIKRLKEQINKIRTNSSGNLTVGISPHSIYNVHPVLWKEIAEFAAEEDILVHTHLGESQSETDWLNGKPSDIDKIHEFVGWGKFGSYETGLNPVEYLEKLGVLSILKENLIAAHCIRLDNELLEKLVSYGTKLASCPRSNMILHGKTLDFNNLSDSVLKNTGLGTDGRLSNEDLNILNEAQFVKENSSLSFHEIMNLLTINPARILKIADKTGSLEKGKNADFLIFKLNENEDYTESLNKEIPYKVYSETGYLNL